MLRPSLHDLCVLKQAFMRHTYYEYTSVVVRVADYFAQYYLCRPRIHVETYVGDNL